MKIDRRTIRYVAAANAAVIAAVYFLIGLGVLTVVAPADDGVSMLFFGLPAGGAFLLGAFLLAAFDRRMLWILGAALQVFVVWGYVAVAPERTPSFEIWGIASGSSRCRCSRRSCTRRCALLERRTHSPRRRGETTRV